MSKDLPQQPQQSEEVDLGQLFKAIGNIFDKFFRFLSNILTGIFKIILLLLTHFYKKIFWYATAIILGFIVGFLLDSKSEKLYGANMFIETNFNSARQVYENIKQFHQLANQDKDYEKLADKLNISEEEASKITGFYIDPDIDENAIAEMYSDFYQRLDSVSRIEMSYDRYKNSLTAYNFRIHRIGVASIDKTIYKKIEKAFIAEISTNDFLKEIVQANRENLIKKDQVLLREVKKTDSLVEEYLKIRLNESKKETVSGGDTNLYMADAGSSSSGLIVDEAKIIEKQRKLEEERIRINTLKVEQKNAVNVLANFPEVGYDISEWYNKMKLIVPMTLIILLLIVFSLLSLGKFLNEENKKTVLKV